MSLAAEHRSPTQSTAQTNDGTSGSGGRTSTLPPQARAAISARARSEVGDLDYIRALRQWVEAGATQTEIAKTLGVTQAAISRLLSRHSATAMPVTGFAGATPLEVCKRYAAGDLSRAEVVDQLTRFSYTPTPAPSAWDDLVVDPPGAWSELETAQGLRLIDATIYRDVFLARHPEYAAEYATEIATEGDVEESGDAQRLEQAGVIGITVQTAAQGEVQGGPQAAAEDGQSVAPRT